MILRAATGWWGFKLHLLPNKINYGKPKETHCSLHSPCLGKGQCRVHLPDLLSRWLISGWPKHKASGQTDHSPDHTTAANYPVAGVATERIKTSLEIMAWWVPPGQAALPILSTSVTASRGRRNVPCPLLGPPHTRLTGNGEGHWENRDTETAQPCLWSLQTGSQKMHSTMTHKTPSLCFWSQQSRQETHSTHEPQIKFLVDDFKNNFGP